MRLLLTSTSNTILARIYLFRVFRRLHIDIDKNTKLPFPEVEEQVNFDNALFIWYLFGSLHGICFIDNFLGQDWTQSPSTAFQIPYGLTDPTYEKNL